MTASDILHIMTLVAGTQLACDFLARKFIFSRNPIKGLSPPSVELKLNMTNSSPPYPPPPLLIRKNQALRKQKPRKKKQRAEEDLAEAAAAVATRHTTPGMFSSLAFLILFRILSIEYTGKVVAVLPFQPWGLLRRITLRGISYVVPEENTMEIMKEMPVSIQDPSQVCSFLFIYLLCTFSMKMLVNKAFGVQPPKGADGGFSTLMDAPRSQKALQSFGIDTDELNEVRKGF